MITLTAVGGDQLLTSCIELNTDTSVGVTYDEGTWTAANVPNIDSVRAILQASYPVRTVAQLQTASGIAGLTTQQAIAGTQGAIWHFTDAINLDRTVVLQNAASNIGRLYDFLLGVAANPAPEPAPTLTITPATAAGTVAPRQKLVLATSDAVTTTATASFDATVAPATMTTTTPADSAHHSVNTCRAPWGRRAGQTHPAGDRLVVADARFTHRIRNLTGGSGHRCDGPAPSTQLTDAPFTRHIATSASRTGQGTRRGRVAKIGAYAAVTSRAGTTARACSRRRG